jgi:hypothetical protein
MPAAPKAPEPKIGERIDSYCGRCKMMLAHTIESIEKGKVKKCHCNTCGAQHAFRAKAPKRSGAAGSAIPESSDYERLIKGRDAASAKKYAISDRFQLADLIKHTNFGLGLVIQCKESNKIDVLFEDGAKTLVHGR